LSPHAVKISEEKEQTRQQQNIIYKYENDGLLSSIGQAKIKAGGYGCNEPDQEPGNGIDYADKILSDLGVPALLMVHIMQISTAR
jgi:hypothetical protein